MLITNPAHVSDPKGYLMVSMKDENNLEDLYRIYFPVESMGHFVPYNLKLVRQSENSPARI